LRRRGVAVPVRVHLRDLPRGGGPLRLPVSGLDPSGARRAPQSPRGSSLPLAAAAAAAFLLLLSLGTWQLTRLAWKEDLLHRIAALAASPAEPLNVVLNRLEDGRDVEFTRVQALCADFGPRVVHLYALHEGRPGWRPIVSCRLTS